MNLEAMTDDALTEIAARSRRSIVSIGYDAGGQGAHVGPALSLVEIMTALYGIAVRHLPTDRLSPDRDRVVLSKGHGSLALYSVLHEYGYIDAALLATAEKDGSPLPGQPIRNRELGIEFSSGSLGMGLSFGVGLALSARMMASNRSIYVVHRGGRGCGSLLARGRVVHRTRAVRYRFDHLPANEMIDCSHRGVLSRATAVAKRSWI